MWSSAQSPNASSGSTYPMQATQVSPNSGNVFQDKSDAATVTVVSSPTRTYTEVVPTTSGPTGLVRLTETRSTMTPTVTVPQTTHSNTWTEELQTTVTTKAYETVRRDVNSMFPGANIISVGRPKQVTTPLGSIFNPANNTFYSHISNNSTPIQSQWTSATTTTQPSWNQTSNPTYSTTAYAPAPAATPTVYYK